MVVTFSHHTLLSLTDIPTLQMNFFKDMGFGSDNSSDESDFDEDVGNRNDGKRNLFELLLQ